MSNLNIFPSKQADLNGYLHTAIPYLTGTATATRLGISTANVNELTATLASWTTIFAKVMDPVQRTKVVTAQKDTIKASIISLMRKVYSDIPQTALTETDREVLNLKARSAPTPAPVPVTYPIAKLDTSNRLRHTIHFVDEATPTKRGKPARTRGCQIWMYVGETAPSHPSQFRLLGTDSASPFINEFDGADANKNAYYMLRWENTRGETGPWGDTVMGTIAA